MKNPFYFISFRWLPILILSILFATIQALAYQPLVSFPFNLLLLKSFIDSLCIVGLGVVLSAVLLSSNYVKLDLFQRFVNYAALGVVFVATWVGTGFLSSYLIFDKEQRVEMLAMLPMTAFVGLLVYVIYLQVIHERARKIENEGETEEVEEAEEVLKGPNDAVDVPVHGKGSVKKEEPLERVAVKSGQKIHVIFVPDIVYIQSDGDYVQIITSHNKYLKEETMKYFEANLPRAQFVRVHRSYIVNVEKILRIETYEKRNQMLTLANGDKIRASVAGYKALRGVLNL